jgi:hypothetical protein
MARPAFPSGSGLCLVDRWSAFRAFLTMSRRAEHQSGLREGFRWGKFAAHSHSVASRRGCGRGSGVQANGQFLVAWVSGDSPTYRVYAARVADNGAITDSTPVAVGDTSFAAGLALAKEKGTKWIAAYGRDTNLFSRTISPK